MQYIKMHEMGLKDLIWRNRASQDLFFFWLLLTVSSLRQLQRTWVQRYHNMIPFPTAVGWTLSRNEVDFPGLMVLSWWNNDDHKTIFSEWPRASQWLAWDDTGFNWIWKAPVSKLPVCRTLVTSEVPIVDSEFIKYDRLFNRITMFTIIIVLGSLERKDQNVIGFTSWQHNTHKQCWFSFGQGIWRSFLFFVPITIIFLLDNAIPKQLIMYAAKDKPRSKWHKQNFTINLGRT
jgi:hypothetical protein